MWQLAASLWHQLSPADKIDWENAATPRHMTGYAYYMSQALRPNPGIYLPLAGGVMSGAIDMDGHQVEGLVDPTNNGQAARKGYVDSEIAAAVAPKGARVYRDAFQSIANNSYVLVSFTHERWDTDFCYNYTDAPTKLVCKTAGIYHITTNLTWNTDPNGHRLVLLYLNGATIIADTDHDAGAPGLVAQHLDTIWELAVNDFVETMVYQDSGGALPILNLPAYSPEFAMHRIG